MSGTCKDCKWWDRNDKGTEVVSRALKAVEKIAKPCRCPRIREMSGTNYHEVGGTDMAGYEQCPDEYDLDPFRTGPDFGCVHFEANA